VVWDFFFILSKFKAINGGNAGIGEYFQCRDWTKE